MKKLLRNLILALTIVAMCCLSSCGFLYDIITPTDSSSSSGSGGDDDFVYVDEPLDPEIPLLTDLSGGNSTYGYEYFANEERGAYKQAFYSAIDAVARDFEEGNKNAEYTNISGRTYAYIVGEVKNDYGLSVDEAISVWKTYRDDNPLAYWISTSVYYETTGTSIYLVTDSAYAKASDRNTKKERITKTMSRYVYEAGKYDNDYEKALCLHDLIISDVNYAYDGNGQPSNEPWAHNIIGVVEKRGVVCEGYARTYQLALNLAGVDNVFVTGTGGTGRDSGGHAWNLVKVGGSWYWVDPTWDDPTRTNNYTSDYPSYDYFMRTDTFLKDHTAHKPTGTNTDYLYGLPARAKSEYTNDGIWLAGEEIKSGDIAYARLRYDGAEVVNADKKYGGFLGLALQSRTLEVPESVEYKNRRYAVVAVKADAFANRTDLTAVTLPSSIKRIRENAFYGCNNLVTLSVGVGLTHIYSGAFYGCNKLETVNYGGDADAFAAIRVDNGNEKFTDANAVYGT